jgi:hypothetical protein
VDVDSRLASRASCLEANSELLLRARRPEKLLRPDAWWLDAEAGDAAANLERLVHAVLGKLGLAEEVPRPCLQETATELGMTQLVEPARHLVRRALQSDWMQRARRAPRSWTALHLSQAAGVAVLHGVLDLVFDEGSGCLVLDFTTRERSPGASAERHRALALRCRLLQQAGQPVLETGTFFLREGVYEPVPDLREKLEALEGTLSRPR